MYPTLYDGEQNFFSKIILKLKNEKGTLATFNGESVIFWLLVREVKFFYMPMTIIKSRYRHYPKLKLKKVLKSIIKDIVYPQL